MEKIQVKPSQLISPGEYEIWSPDILKIYFGVCSKGHGSDLPQIIIADTMHDINAAPKIEQEKENLRRTIGKIGCFEQVVGQAKPVKIEGIDYYIFPNIQESECLALGLLPPLRIGQNQYLTPKGISERQAQLKRQEDYEKGCLDDKLNYYQGIFEKIAQMKKDGVPYILLDGVHRSIASELCHQSVNALRLQSDEDIRKLKEMVQSGELFGVTGHIESKRTLKDLVWSFYECCNENVEHCLPMSERVQRLVAENKVPEYMRQAYLQGAK